ncbi:MAG: ABC transporter permease [Phycisphaeraceae bacterium]|nr:ABC transporter permease [Phycisphaeraceae bacterium]
MSERRKIHPVVTMLALPSLLLLYLPLVAVAVYSVNSARIGLVWEGFTLRWYRELLHNEAMLDAARNTMILGLVSTAIATVLGTLLALGLARFPWPKPIARTLDVIVDLPVVTPDIIFAAAMVIAFSMLRSLWAGFVPGMLAMVIGHVTFQISFVALVVRSRLVLIGPTLMEAGRDLYASSFYLFRKVTLPLLLPAIVAGAMLAFTLSLDDFVISFFTAGPKSNTLPILIYSAQRRGLSPQIHAISTLIVILTVALVLGLERFTRYRKA